MAITHLLIWGSWVIFAIVTLWALGWAVRHHQFDSLQNGARVIFDEEEPIGEVTDWFPSDSDEESDS